MRYLGNTYLFRLYMLPKHLCVGLCLAVAFIKTNNVWGVFYNMMCHLLKLFQFDPTCIIILVGENEGRR